MKLGDTLGSEPGVEPGAVIRAEPGEQLGADSLLVSLERSMRVRWGGLLVRLERSLRVMLGWSGLEPGAELAGELRRSQGWSLRRNLG